MDKLRRHHRLPADAQRVRDAARDLLADLLDQQWSPRAIADAYDLPLKTVETAAERWAKGRHLRPGQAFARRLLTGPVRRPTVGLVPAWPATRRLQALACLGWSTSQLAARLGVARSVVGEIQTGDRSRIAASTDVAVRDLYDRLQGTPVDAPNVAGRAVARGWAPPLAWDDIDDSSARPVGMADGRRSKAALVEDVVDLLGQRARLDEAAARLGLKVESLDRMLHKAGRGDLVTLLKTPPDERPAVRGLPAGSPSVGGGTARRRGPSGDHRRSRGPADRAGAGAPGVVLAEPPAGAGVPGRVGDGHEVTVRGADERPEIDGHDGAPPTPGGLSPLADQCGQDPPTRQAQSGETAQDWP